MNEAVPAEALAEEGIKAPVPPPARPAVNPWLIAIVVSLATFIEVLDTTITNVSLSHIAGNLAASQDESTWVLTSYLVSNGIVLPISGWLSNVIGRKRYFMLCIAGFTLASFACGAATSLAMLVVFRLLQGIAGGGLQPTQQAIILDAFPPEKRGAVFGITGVTLIVAPIIGPTLGGWITDNFSWRWIFFINVPIGLITLFLVNRLVEDPPHAKAQGLKSIDYVSLLLVASGLGALQVVLDKGQQEDWFDSNFICGFALASAVCLTGAIVRLWGQKDPIIEVRLLASRGFGLPCVLVFMTGFVLYSGSTLLPLMVQSQFGYDATLAGLILSPGGLAVVFLMPVAGRLVSRVPAKYLIAVGMVLCSAGMAFTAFVTPQTDYRTLVGMRILEVIGLPFLFIPTSTLAFSMIPKEKNNKASALYALARNMGGSIGIALVTTYLVRHEQIRQAYLSGAVTAYRPAAELPVRVFAGALQKNGYSEAAAQQLSLGHFYRQFLSQASFLAYHDAFLLMAAIAGGGAFLTLLLPVNRLGKAPVAAGH